MPYYKNTSKFYKRITVDGSRLNIPPDGTFYSTNVLNLEINTNLELVDSTAPPPPKPPEQVKEKKIEVVDTDQFQSLKNAILALNEKVDSLTAPTIVETRIKSVLDSTPHVEQEEINRMAIEIRTLSEILNNNPTSEILKRISDIDTHIKEVIMRRQEVLKKAIDEVNTAVMQIEEYVYNERESNMIPIVVMDDEKPKDTGPSLEDIIRGTYGSN